MRLILIGKGRRWTVYAACTDEVSCPLLDFIAELDTKRAAKVMSDLKEFVPDSTPAEWARIEFSWPLRGSDAIFEFRWRARRGTPRVFWFYDEGNVIVCSHGLNKKDNELDPHEVRTAEAMKARYRRDKQAKQVRVTRLEQFDPDADDEENNDG